MSSAGRPVERVKAALIEDLAVARRLADQEVEEGGDFCFLGTWAASERRGDKIRERLQSGELIRGEEATHGETGGLGRDDRENNIFIRRRDGRWIGLLSGEQDRGCRKSLQQMATFHIPDTVSFPEGLSQAVAYFWGNSRLVPFGKLSASSASRIAGLILTSVYAERK